MSAIVVAGDTSGTITIAAPAVAGSGTLTLPVATDTLAGIAATQTLTNKSIAATQLTGTIAASALPAGSVLQVVNATYSGSVANNTGTYANTNLTATITPKFNTSKVLVLVNQNGVYTDGNATSGVNLKLVRDSTDLSTFGLGVGIHASGNLSYGSSSTCYLDSPATTSATVYKTQFVRAVLGQVFVQEGGGTVSTITLMEIAV